MEMYRNVMELLVEEEVNRQIRLLARTLGVSLKRTEISPYALNRLPSLYASTQEGVEYQLRRGRKQFGKQINQAVKEAILTVRRNPSRICTPLTAKADARKPEARSNFPDKHAISSSFKARTPHSLNDDLTVVQPRSLDDDLTMIQPRSPRHSQPPPTARPTATPHPMWGDNRSAKPAAASQDAAEPTHPKKREVTWQEYKRLRKTKEEESDDGWDNTFLR